MSISAMKQALEALEEPDQCSVEAMWKAKDILRQAIAEAEQPDLARVGEVGVWGEEKNT
jgi:hypothetical protein